MFLRSSKKLQAEVKLSDPIGKDKDDNVVTLQEVLEADIQHPGYIFPEYIYGYINPDTEEIEENPISVENRKKYKYQFLNGQTTCVDDRVKY